MRRMAQSATKKPHIAALHFVHLDFNSHLLVSVQSAFPNLRDLSLLSYF